MCRLVGGHREATGSQISTCCKQSLQNSTSERTTIPNAKDSLASSVVTRYQTVVPNKVANEPNSNAKKQTKQLLHVHSKLVHSVFCVFRACIRNLRNASVNVSQSTAY